MLTLGQVQETLPANHRNNMTQDMVDQLNNLSVDPEEARYMRDNFVSYSQVLQEGRFKIGDYVKAVMYCSHKIMGKTNMASYIATFPERHNQMVQAGKAPNQISSIVTGYNKGALVTKIMERAIIPSWILNQDMFQSALNTQYELMTDVMVSDKVRSDAANSILTHLKKPDVHKAELKIEIAASDGMAELEANIKEMSRQQLNQIEHNPNVTTSDITGKKMRVVNPDD
jgi:hypothetical protein